MAATASAPAETREAPPKLKRTIGLWMATALVVGNMIGDFTGFQTAWGYWIAVWASNAAIAVCEAPSTVRLERAAERAARGSISDAGPAIVAAELGIHGGRFQPPGPPLARLDTTRPISELLDALASELDAHLGGAS